MGLVARLGQFNGNKVPKRGTVTPTLILSEQSRHANRNRQIHQAVWIGTALPAVDFQRKSRDLFFELPHGAGSLSAFAAADKQQRGARDD